MIKDKILSALAGAIIGGGIVFMYGNYINIPDTDSDTANTLQNRGFEGQGRGGGEGRGPGGRGGNIDPENMTPEQKQRMAERAGITVKEFQAKIDAGEDIRSIMGNRGTGEKGQKGNIGSGQLQKGSKIDVPKGDEKKIDKS